MSTLHYFQRYSQKENWLTNSTLLLFQHFYLYKPLKFQSYLNSLDEQLELRIGPVFQQQTRTDSSVPDGSIVQRSFDIRIEAKPEGNLRIDQLAGHLTGFESELNKILLILTRDEVEHELEKRIITELRSVDETVTILFTTYQEIYETLKGILNDFDTEMLELLDDYASLCQEWNLFQTAQHTMLGVSCSKSIEQNLKYQIYYDSLDRNHNLPFNYMGIYEHKRIVAVGKVDKIVGVNYDGEQLIPTKNEDSFKTLTQDEKRRIINTIKETSVYTLTSGIKFFLLSDMTNTNFKKDDSAAAIQSKRYFFFKDMEGFKNDMPAYELAKLLDGKYWE